MKRIILVTVVATFVLAARGEDKKPVRDALPRADAVEWDLQVFEDSPAFTVAKREVKGNTITWVLENKRDLGTEILLGYQAAFVDADGVKLFTVGIEVSPFLMNLSKGERNRYVLNLPRAESWKAARKVVIKNGLLNN